MCAFVGRWGVAAAGRVGGGAEPATGTGSESVPPDLRFVCEAPEAEAEGAFGLGARGLVAHLSIGLARGRDATRSDGARNVCTALRRRETSSERERT